MAALLDQAMRNDIVNEDAGNEYESGSDDDN